MNILVIGNGFDLAHGLPTKYTDFLKWVKKYQQFYSYASRKRTASYKEVEEQLLHYFNELFYMESKKKICDEIYRLINENIWIEYFLQNPMYQKENWIDFESEISAVIRSVENNMQGDIEGYVTNLDNSFLSKKYIDSTLDFGAGKIEYKKFSELRDILLNDLNRLIRAFEIYLCDYVANLKIMKNSPDIQELRIHHMLSFNYTGSYSKLYSFAKTVSVIEDPFDYIHGKADINNSIETNNMVLGIDEYLSKKRKDKDIEFIAFKKYYQRIYKETGCHYKNWIDTIKEGQQDIEELKKQYPVQIPLEKFTRKHNLYIFGHSLDITDRDILRDLILNDNVYTTIFYPDKKELGKKIANLVKVIGQDELIRRTGGNTKTIEFKLQQAMVERE